MVRNANKNLVRDAVGACVMKSTNAKGNWKVSTQLVANLKAYQAARTSSARGPLLEAKLGHVYMMKMGTVPTMQSGLV